MSADNATAIAPAIAALEAHLARFRVALELGDEDEIRGFFSSGYQWFARHAPRASGEQHAS